MAGWREKAWVFVACLAFALCDDGAVLAQSPSSVRASAPPIQALDYFRTRIARSPKLSPDGKWIVYARIGRDIASDRSFTRLWLHSLADGAERALDGAADAPPPEFASSSGAVWSPDGRKIAFVAGQKGAEQIYQYTLATGEAVCISSLAAMPSRLAWSPDGKHIAFLMPIAEQARQVPMPDPPAGAHWQGKQDVREAIVYRYDGGGASRPRRHALYVMPAGGGAATRLSADDVSFAGYGGFTETQGFPSWTPDGREIVIGGRPVRAGVLEADDFNSTLEAEIHAYSLDGAVRRIAGNAGGADLATISPDGRWIAYLAPDNGERFYQQANLWIMPAAGGTPRKLTGGLDRDLKSFAWDADGHALVIGYEDGGRNRIARIDLEGRLHILAADAGSDDDIYVGKGIDISTGPAGMVAYTVQTGEAPGDLGLWSKGKLRRLTQLNAEFFASRALGTYEERWFASPADGRKIQAFVLKPPHFDPSRRYPMMMWIHGGPHAAMGAQYDYERQRIAGAGYVMLLVNPRGSTGFGTEFGDALQDDFPGAAITADLMAAVDMMEREPWIDPDRLYVGGGSAGGVMTNWLIGNTTRFRAAVSAYSIFDMASWSLENDMPIRVMRQWFSATPWENPEEYWRRSPMRFAQSIQTPTLILTGGQDWRVPATQSEKLFTALKLRGVETRLIAFPDDKHSINAIPSNRIAKVSAIIDWMDSHGGREEE